MSLHHLTPEPATSAPEARPTERTSLLTTIAITALFCFGFGLLFGLLYSPWRYSFFAPNAYTVFRCDRLTGRVEEGNYNHKFKPIGEYDANP